MADPTINALGGGAPLPQADTATIARRLLGPLADRYGDVIGIRPTSAQDVARDFSIGALSGDPFKADQIKSQVVQQYNQEARAQEDQLFQREQAAREQVTGFFELLKQGRSVPKDLRKDFFKETLPQVGVDPTSPLFLKILSDDKFGELYDALLDPQLQEAMQRDPIQAAQKMVDAGHDGSLALGVIQQVQQMRRYNAETQGIMARTSRTNALAGPGDIERRRDQLRNRLVGRKTKDRLGRETMLSPEQIEDLVNRFIPLTPTTQAGIPQVAPPPSAPPAAPAGAASVPTDTATTGGTPVTETPSTVAGIPQAAPAVAPAAEGQQKVRRITGTVQKVQ